jgi:hypothetical protein
MEREPTELSEGGSKTNFASKKITKAALAISAKEVTTTIDSVTV